MPSYASRNHRLVATPEEEEGPVFQISDVTEKCSVLSNSDTGRDSLSVYCEEKKRLSASSEDMDYAASIAESIESGYTGSVNSKRASFDESFCSASEVEHKSVKSGVTLLQMVSTFRGKLPRAEDVSYGDDFGNQIDISGNVPVRRIEVHPPAELV
jgi:hypothetical protein